MKQCKQCGELKPADDFSLAPGNRDGRHTVCKECRCIVERQRRAARRPPLEREPEPLQLPGERWRDVPGLEGYYQVSDRGRVRSVDRYVEKRDGRGQIFPGTIIRPQRAGGKRRPYLHVSLQVQGQRVGVFVHQLVALAFIGVPPRGHDVHHINGRSTDNRAHNLVYARKVEHLSAHNRGGMNPSAVLSEGDIINIRKLLAQGQTAASIARDYGVTKGAIYDIRHGRTWKHIPTQSLEPMGVA